MPSKNKGAALPATKQNKNAAPPGRQPANAQKKPVKKQQGPAKQTQITQPAVGAASAKKIGKEEEIPAEPPMSLEELIENERNALSDQCARVTLETFNVWKREKLKQKRKRELAEERQKLAAIKQGKRKGLSGRDLLQLNPEDDEEVTPIHYEKEAGEDDTGAPVKPFEIDEKTFLDVGNLLDGLSINNSDDAASQAEPEGEGDRDENGRQ